jgi:hypothetical protein
MTREERGRRKNEGEQTRERFIVSTEKNQRFKAQQQVDIIQRRKRRVRAAPLFTRGRFVDGFFNTTFLSPRLLPVGALSARIVLIYLFIHGSLIFLGGMKEKPYICLSSFLFNEWLCFFASFSACASRFSPRVLFHHPSVNWVFFQLLFSVE